MSPRSLLVLVLPFVFACGSSVGEASSELQAACQSFFAERVAYGNRCNGVPPAAAEEQAYVDSCIGIATAPGSRLVAADVTACAKELAVAACTGYGDVYPSCAGVGANLLYPNHDKKGSLSPGEACFAHLQCDSGYCGAFLGCGTCQRVRALGETCSLTEDVCAEGNCSGGICQHVGAKVGEACIDYGGSECQEMLYCKRFDPSGIEGTCASRGVVGGACDAATPCVEGLFCEESVCQAPRPDGEACAYGGQCQHSACDGGKCRAIRFGLGVGEDCTIDICALELLCDGASRVCKPISYVPNGGDCDGVGALGQFCEPGSYCDVACNYGVDCSGTCEVFPGQGENCTAFGGCGEGTSCVGFDSSDLTKGKCARLGGEGEACPCGEALTCVGALCVAFGDAVCPSEP